MRRFSYWSIGVVTCVMLVLTVAFLDPEPARAQRPPEAGGQNLDARLTAVEDGLAAETVARAEADLNLAARLAAVEQGLAGEAAARADGDQALLDLLTGQTNVLCQEIQRMAGNPSSEAIALCGDRLFKTVFVTSTIQGFLGLAGADNNCNARAQAAGLPGTYTAWLSDSLTDARDRVTQATVPYVNTVGDTVADNFADLVNCGPSCLQAPIGFDEFGLTSSNLTPWTATNELGISKFGDNVFLTCNDWFTNNPQCFLDGTCFPAAAKGSISSINVGWTGGATHTCNHAHALFCFQN